MSQSTISTKSLDLDSIKPPSQLNSLTNSAIGLDKGVPRSPKLVSRKKSLPGSLLVKRALSNSLHHSSRYVYFGALVNPNVTEYVCS